jgi:glycosyltransferase involved in cell wall biosynthesis
VRLARAFAAGGAGGEREQKVYILLMSAWGMGGTIRTALQVAGHLAKTHDVEVLSIVRRRAKPFFEFPAGVTVTAIDDQRRSQAPSGAAGWLRRTLLRRRTRLLSNDRSRDAMSLWTDLQILRALRSLGPGVLITTRPSLNVVAAELAPSRIATIAQEHMHFGAHRRPLAKAIGTSYPALDAVVTLTEADRSSYVEALGTGVRVEAIPNAVPELGGAPSPLAGKLVLGAGRLRRQKAFALLITAFAQVAPDHPGWNLLIAGEGPRRPVLEALVRDLGLEGRVSLPGRIRHLGAEMERASIFALSSRFEGFPMVLLEAFAKGLPVVSFDCPTGPRELIDHERDGLLVPNGDVPGLARAIAQLMDDEDARRRYGDAALQKASRYRLDRVGARWEALVGELLARGGSSRQRH